MFLFIKDCIISFDVIEKVEFFNDNDKKPCISIYLKKSNHNDFITISDVNKSSIVEQFNDRNSSFSG